MPDRNVSSFPCYARLTLLLTLLLTLCQYDEEKSGEGRRACLVLGVIPNDVDSEEEHAARKLAR